MLSGQMLYLEEDMHKLLDRVRKADIPPVVRRRPDVPREVERAIMRALAKKPDLRWQHASDFAATLEAWLHGHAPDFSAGRLATWAAETMRDPGAPPANEPIMSRAEFTDENSIIFALGDLRPQSPKPDDTPPPRPARPAPRAPDRATTPSGPSLPSIGAAPPVTATKPIVSPRAAGAARAPDRVTDAAPPATNETIELGLHEIEEAGEKTRLSLAPTTAQASEPATDRTIVTDEPTQIDAVDAVDAIDAAAASADQPAEPADSAEPVDTSDEDPTRLDVAGLAGRTRTPPERPPEPAPAPVPARRTRRTPGAGVPVGERRSRRRHEPGASGSQRLPLAPPAEPTSVSPPPRAADRPERVWPPAATPEWGTSDADDSLPFKLVRRMPWRRIALGGGAACIVAAAVALAVAWATRPPPPPEFASIEIISIPPGARLSVDGRDAGTTPVTLDRLPIGSRLKMRIDLDRHEPWERSDAVGANGGKIIASLKPILGELVVDGTPLGAEVFLNNKSIGVLPLRKGDMDPYADGVVEVRKVGFKPVRRPFTWSGDRRVELRVELLPARE
jgi:hypothetical protein